MKYTITVEYIGQEDYEVEADTLEEAENIACERHRHEGPAATEIKATFCLEL